MTSWRLLPFGRTDGFWQMAADEVLLDRVAAGKSAPTIRVYGWKPSALSFGIAQSPQDFDLGECARRGIDVVRRPTGGGALLHDSYSLTYAVIGKEKELGDIASSYSRICGAVQRAIRATGVKAEFSSEHAPAEKYAACVARRSAFNDLVVKGRKVAGNAQARRGGAILQHGSVFYGTNLRLMGALTGDSTVPQKAITMKVAGAKSIAIAWNSLEAELANEFKTTPSNWSVAERKEIDAAVQLPRESYFSGSIGGRSSVASE